MQKIIALAIACVLIAWSPLLAQSRPDFSGTWVVEKVERPVMPGGGPGGPGPGVSRRGGMGGPSGGGPEGNRAARPTRIPREGDRVRIEQTADRLIVTAAIDGGEQTSAFALDGTESSNPAGRGLSRSRTKWEGAALVTDASQTFEAPMGEMTLKTREVRSLSDDDTRMVVRTTVESPRGKRTTTVTYIRGDNK